MSFTSAQIKNLRGVQSINGQPFTPGGGGTILEPFDPLQITSYITLGTVPSGSVPSLKTSNDIRCDTSGILYYRNWNYPHPDQDPAHMQIVQNSSNPKDINLLNVSSGNIYLNTQNSGSILMESLNNSILTPNGDRINVSQGSGISIESVTGNLKIKPTIGLPTTGHSLVALDQNSNVGYKAPIFYGGTLEIFSGGTIPITGNTIKNGMVIFRATSGSANFQLPTGTELANAMNQNSILKNGAIIELFVCNPNGLPITILSNTDMPIFGPSAPKITSFTMKFMSNGVTGWSVLW